MNIQVSLLPNLISTPSALAIVIDTLRFTTTACQAFKSGAEELQVASEIDQIRSMRDASSRAKDATALCGERHGHKIDGFDLGNSPYEYTSESVSGKSLFFTTTNGTRAISAAQESGTTSVWLAALINRHAVAQRLHSESPDHLRGHRRPDRIGGRSCGWSDLGCTSRLSSNHRGRWSRDSIGGLGILSSSHLRRIRNGRGRSESHRSWLRKGPTVRRAS